MRLKSTTSRCPVCLAQIPAEITRRGDAVVMTKHCPAHGAFEATLAADHTRYYASQGSGACCSPADGANGGGCCAPANPNAADPFERLSTCVALIEIVESCNLSCPTCFASSPHGVGDDLAYTPSREVRQRIAGVVARKGFIDIIQLSGGEPTLHPDFFEILEWCLAHPKIGYILVNTNAVRVATDAAFREKLGELRRARGKFELYVQFDGVQEAGQRELRGVDGADDLARPLLEQFGLDLPRPIPRPRQTVHRGAQRPRAAPADPLHPRLRSVPKLFRNLSSGDSLDCHWMTVNTPPYARAREMGR